MTFMTRHRLSVRLASKDFSMEIYKKAPWRNICLQGALNCYLQTGNKIGTYHISGKSSNVNI